MNFRTLSLGAAATALLATSAIAQNTIAVPSTPPAATAPSSATSTTTTTSTTTEAIRFTSSVTSDQMLLTKLTGTDVRNAAGENLGNVNDIVLDKAGKPTVAIIGVGGFLGMGEKNVGVPFEALQFTMSSDTNKRVARLDVTKEALKSAPTFVYADKTQAENRPAVKTQ